MSRTSDTSFRHATLCVLAVCLAVVAAAPSRHSGCTEAVVLQATAPSASGGLAFTTDLPSAPAASRRSTRQRTIVAPASWRTVYYDVMRDLHGDTVRTGFLRLHHRSPRFEELSFMVADSLPGHLAFGYTDAVELLGMASPAKREVVLLSSVAVGRTVPVWLLRHEFAHIVSERVDHPSDIFSSALQTVWNVASRVVDGVTSAPTRTETAS